MVLLQGHAWVSVHLPQWGLASSLESAAGLEAEERKGWLTGAGRPSVWKDISSSSYVNTRLPRCG